MKYAYSLTNRNFTQRMCRVIAKQVQTLKSFNMNSIKETRHYLFPVHYKDKIKNI